MIGKVFKFNNSYWYKAILIILFWVLGVAYLIHEYGYEYTLALVDVAIHTFYLLLGFFLLENIFRFYTPQESNIFIFMVFPTVITVLVYFAGKYSLEFLLQNQVAYLRFLSEVDLVKAFVLFLLLLGYALILLFQSKIESQLQTMEREEQIVRLAKEAELYQLRQQLQPHFLFNSLNSISSLLRKRPEEAREMVIQLSDFLRKTIRKDEQKWISVSEELAYLDLFVSIEKVRFGHRLKIDFDVKDDPKLCSMPQLLVQPLLENAIKHGLYGVLGEVVIALSFKFDAPYLIINIKNPYDPMAGQTVGEGFGLQSIKRRLYLLFGRHDLLHTQSNGEIFEVEMKIPQNYDQYNNH